MKTNLFLIRSPLQALNAIEAKERFCPNNDNIVIIFYRRKVDKKLILNTLEYTTWTDIILQPLKPHYNLYKFLKYFLKYRPNVNYCFIGDYSTLINYFMNRLIYNRLFILEDGTATIREIKLLENKTLHKIGKTSYKIKHPSKILMEKIFKLDTQYLYNASFFTIYQLDTTFPTIQNKYSYLKKLIPHKPTKDIVFFIGSNLTDSILISKEKFEYLLSEVASYYKKRNLKLIYILHRKEDPIYINDLIHKLEIESIQFKHIIEIELLKLDYIPTEISTFISSAITTLPVLYPTNYSFIQIEENMITDKFIKPIKEVEEMFYQRNIKKITL